MPTDLLQPMEFDDDGSETGQDVVFFLPENFPLAILAIDLQDQVAIARGCIPGVLLRSCFG